MNDLGETTTVQWDTALEAIERCYELGWTDGLPVVPPTEDLVRRMLATYGEDPSISLGLIQPRNAQVTLEKLAINSVMAGCQPEYFPVVVAAVQAVLQEEFCIISSPMAVHWRA